jgi:hypothetical protein
MYYLPSQEMSDHPRDKHGRFIKGSEYKLSERHKENIRLTKIGEKNPMYGRNFSEEHRRKLGLKSIGRNRAERNGYWKGDNAKIGAIHLWVRSHLPKPELCPMCKIKPPFDLANITGIYNREFKNWKYLCRKCHMVSDGRIIRNLVTARLCHPKK